MAGLGQQGRGRCGRPRGGCSERTAASSGHAAVLRRLRLGGGEAKGRTFWFCFSCFASFPIAEVTVLFCLDG